MEITATDLIGEIVSAKDVSEIIVLLSTAYGRTYANEIADKIKILFGMIREDHWTSLRFQETARWIVKNRPYANWNISDWYSAPLQKLYTYSKYISELHEKGRGLNAEIQWYVVNDLNLWVYKKDGELPFEKYIPKQITTHEQTKEVIISENVSDVFKNLKEKLGEYKELKRENKLKTLEELLPSID